MSLAEATADQTPEADFVGVTEMAGHKVSAEQLDRTCHRYYWARSYVQDRDVLEVACGSGPGLGYLQQYARSLRAGDISRPVLNKAIETYGSEIELSIFDAGELPAEDASLDVILLYEAIYYLPNPGKFFRECARALRPGGHVLIVTANKDLYDFNPSPHSVAYYGTTELNEFARTHGFLAEFWGHIDTSEVSLRQRIFRPIKLIASRLGLIPGSMRGKELLKRMVFGELKDMPASIVGVPHDYRPPTKIDGATPDRRHKVLYCAARLRQDDV